MKTIITGAAGMIGSGIVRHLNDSGHKNLILVDDLKESDKWKNLVGKEFLDIISKHKIFEWLKGREGEVDAIVHMGACSDTVETDGDYLLENNFRFTVRLAEWALRANKRFVYASSAATYGDGSMGFDDDEAKLETLRPMNMYGFSKQLVDLWMKREGVLNRVVGLKYFNVFGPNEYHKGRMASMVLKMTQKAQDEGVIQLYKSNDPKYADGGQVRDFIYVKDAVKMTCALLEPKYRNVCGIFNVGRGEVTTWNFLAEALFKALQRGPNIIYIPMPRELDRQYQNYTCAIMDKFHKIFSSDPKYIETVPIEPAVREYVQEYLMRNSRW
ncbi:MAG TPA: ADP-glyceromanno-heptose 6-epimerase [Chlamydiales bacterium]|nr:ADP-glyceromanno-heptose 6-epimerase [Chlamydiales bacterium]